MNILLSILILLSPVWVPILTTSVYAFVLRDKLPNKMYKITDMMYWCVYFGLWLCAMMLFVMEIFGWQMEPLYRWLWLIGLGIPMLMVMVIVLFLSIMVTDSW